MWNHRFEHEAVNQSDQSVRGARLRALLIGLVVAILLLSINGYLSAKQMENGRTPAPWQAEFGVSAASATSFSLEQ